MWLDWLFFASGVLAARLFPLHPSLSLVTASRRRGRACPSPFPPGSPTGGIATILMTTPGGGYYGYFTFEKTEIPRG